jgi:ABC-type antimicrobial peptide transport system, ATPase component
VGLTNQKNQKAVTLSGGQKQRMVIARALAVNSPVILADEPTGNLDAESGKEIMELLYSFRRDRLIIVVTHNYEQIEPYATRKLRFHDGELVEDIVLKPIEAESNADEKIAEVSTKKDQKNETKACLRATVLSLKNTPKRTVFMTILFVLASFVFLLIVASNTSSYTDDYTNNNTFPNNDINRLVVKNENNSLFTQADFDKIESINNYGGMVKYDFLTDIAFFYVPENPYDYLRFYVKPISVYNKKSVIYGSLPENNNEIFLSVPADRQDEFNELLNKTIEFKCNSDNYFTQEESKIFSFKLTGFIVNKNTSDKYNILVNDEQIRELGVNLFFTYFPQRAEILGVSMSGGIKPVSYDVAIDNNVSDGKATLVVNSMHEGNLDFPLDEAFIDKAVEITVNTVFDNLTTTVSINKVKTEKFNINILKMEN